jgi:murein DD-endopeptidase MepM/ murein hydrolase activator NlpD
MMRIRTRIIAILALGMLFAGLSLPAANQARAKSARWTKNQMQRNRATRDKLFDRIKQLGKNEKLLSTVLNGIDDQIEQKDGEVRKIQRQLDEASKNQVQMEGQQQQLEGQLQSAQESLGERARALYMQNDLTYIDVLFQSVNVSDFIDRMIYLQAIHRRDKMLIEETRQKRTELEGQLAQISQQIAAIAQIKQSLLHQQDALEQARGDKELDIEAIKADKALAMRQAKELEDENKHIAAQLRAIGRSASGYKGKPWAGSFKKPCAGTITSGYGMRFHPILHVNKMHTGVDISAATGTTIVAAGDGKVVYAGWRGGYGKCVIVEHGGGRSTLYGHMSRITCSVGDIVTTSSKLGEVGSTGFSTGPHCHFEVRINGDPTDPLQSL